VKELVREYLHENFSTMDANDTKISQLLNEFSVICKKISISNPGWEQLPENSLAAAIYNLVRNKS
jgi:hypothetical protein